MGSSAWAFIWKEYCHIVPKLTLCQHQGMVSWRSLLKSSIFWPLWKCNLIFRVEGKKRKRENQDSWVHSHFCHWWQRFYEGDVKGYFNNRILLFCITQGIEFSPRGLPLCPEWVKKTGYWHFFNEKGTNSSQKDSDKYFHVLPSPHNVSYFCLSYSWAFRKAASPNGKTSSDRKSTTSIGKSYWVSHLMYLHPLLFFPAKETIIAAVFLRGVVRLKLLVSVRHLKSSDKSTT